MVPAALGPDPQSILPPTQPPLTSPSSPAHPAGKGRCFLKRPNQRQVMESGCYGDRHVPSLLALPETRFTPRCVSLVTASDNQVLTPAHGSSLRKRALRTTPRKREQIDLAPSRQPSPLSWAKDSHLLTLPAEDPVTSLEQWSPFQLQSILCLPP